VDTFAAARFYTDRHSSPLDQAVMCQFLTEGHFGRHIRRMRELYATRLAALRDAAHHTLAGLIDIPNVQAGIHVTARIARGWKADAVAAAATEVGIETIPIRRFVLAAARPEALLLGFAPYDPRQIRDAVGKLARAFDRHARFRAARPFSAE